MNLILSPLWTLAIAKLGFLAPDGRCRAFDAAARGMVRSEGCGVVVLKRLADALADRDHIWALVRGSATNQDGRTNGLTAPNGLAQQAMLRQALASAGVGPAEIGYVEAHGTGTTLGDPIEVEALAEVLGRAGDRPCLLGSVKTNIGHVEGAAGIAGLIKTVLVLRHGLVPPPVHFRRLNPHIALGGTRLAVPAAPAAWPRGSERRLAGVSAFGFGGTNAHVVLEEAPADGARAEGPGGAARLLVLSARSDGALRVLAGAVGAQLETAGAEASLADVCATAALRRTHYAHRLAVAGASAEELVMRLREAAEGPARLPALGQPPRVAFVFSGQGTQWPGMGLALAEREPAFREALEACEALVRAEAGWSLREALADPDPRRLERTAIAQPAIFALQVGLASLLRTWGVTPQAVTGHSVGEVAAAHVAGALDLASAIRVVVHRARLMDGATGGGRMVSVELPAADAAHAIAPYREQLAVAAMNGPDSTVLAGAPEALARVVEGLQIRGITCRWLPVDYAFHSPQMEPFREPLGRALAGLAPDVPGVALISTVTGEEAAPGDYGAEYWGRSVREPVRFEAAIATLARRGVEVFVELGPHPVLGGSITRSLTALGQAGVTLASLRRGQAEPTAMLALLGRLWERGQAVSWPALHPHGGRRVRLPLTPWEHQPYPFRVTKRLWEVAPSAGAPAGHPLLARRLDTALPVFETRLDTEAPAFLGDHRIHGAALLAGTAIVEMVLAAGETPEGPRAIADLVIGRPLPLDGPRVVQVAVGAGDSDQAAVRVFSRGPGTSAGASSWTLHASARLERRPPAPSAAGRLDLNVVRTRCATAIDADAHEARRRQLGADFGPGFQVVRQIFKGAAEVLVDVALPASLAPEAHAYHVHPALLDGCLQGVLALLDDSAALHVPVSVDAVRVWARAGANVWGVVRVETRPGGLVADVDVMDPAGTLVAELRGVSFRPARGRPDADGPGGEPLYELVWRLQPSPSFTPVKPGHWLVLPDAGPGSAAVAGALRARGERVTIGPVRGNAEALQAAVAAGAAAWTGIVDLRGLEAVLEPDADGPWVQAMAVEACAGVLELVQSLGSTGAAPRLWIVTRGAQPVVAGQPVAVVQASLWGVTRVVALEHPELRTTLLDLDPDGAPGELDALASHLVGAGADDQIALRGGERRVARLVPWRFTAQRQEGEDGSVLRLDLAARGGLDDLTWVRAPRSSPGPGQIAIRVQATGLNFRDVLNALGLYPGDPGPLGNECAGTVVAVGAGVTGLAPGDRVIAAATGAFATTVIVDAALAVRMPAGLTAAAAATIPIAFLTAREALAEVAGLHRGQRVLIHAAAGGVGLAAVAISQRLGAEVLGSAGSPEKRDLLASLGVRHVVDSRSLAFADQVMARTAGEGVDVVLNSLSGEFIPRSLGVVRPGGCFVELGKRGIWEATDVAAVRPDIRYHVLYLGDCFERDPARIQGMLAQIAADLDAGHLRPLPHRVFPGSDVVAAFRWMAQARHVGKVVVTPPGSDSPARSVRAEATYLVTGGMGALGLQTAAWLREHGARHLVLMGRSEPTAEAAAAVARLRQSGAEVRIARGDVARPEDVSRVMEEIAAELPPLRGVIHAAGAVEDAVVEGQTRPRLATAMAAKVAGAWNLHRATAGLDLDLFVLFSSMAGLLGSPGQANYAAGNAHLDALAAHRRALGLPALSVQWGPWAGPGMAAAVGERDRERWQSRGIHALTPPAALAALEALVAAGPAAPAGAAALPFDWARYAATAGGRVSSMLAELIPGPDAAGPAAVAPRPELLRRLDEAPPARRRQIVLLHVREEAARVLQLPPMHRLDADRGLKELGLDSLMAVELRNRLQAGIGRSLSVTLAFDCPTVNAIADHLVVEIGGVAGAEDAAQSHPVTDSAADDGVQDLSEEEATALLVAELARPTGAERGPVSDG